MKQIVENITRRPVTIFCNSGKAYHLPPKYSGEFPSNEIKNNKMLDELVKKHVLVVKEAKLEKKSSRRKEKSE